MRSLRRWLLVAGAWAVAASAIGLIALFTDDDDRPRQDVASADELAELSSRVDRLDDRLGQLSSQDQELSDRIDAGESRIDDLEGELSDARAQSRETTDMVDALRQQTTDLEDRLSELEAEVQSADTAGEGGSATGGSR